MTFICEAHWRDLDPATLYGGQTWAQRWPNFTPQELVSKDDDGSLIIHIDFLDRLQLIRELCGRPLVMNSVYRTPAYNRRVGGVRNSQHVLGRAGDIAIGSALYGEALVKLAREVGMTGIGIYQTFIHVDNRTGRRATWRGKK